MTIHSQSKEITRSGQYWAFAQFARFIRRGAKRFATETSATDLGHVAVENPDGSSVLVLTNKGPARSASVQLGARRTDIPLEENSVTTLVWS